MSKIRDHYMPDNIASTGIMGSYVVECQHVSHTQFRAKVLVHTNTKILDNAASTPCIFHVSGRWY